MAAAAKWKPAAGGRWRDALEREHPSHGKVVRIPAAKRKPGAPRALLIPRPLDLEARVRRVRKGRILRLGALRADLARGTAADLACPLTTGIFLRVVAEAAEEDRRAGKQRITPYWRVVRDDGSLFEKFPGGIAAQARRLRAEGHRLVRGRLAAAARA